MTQEEIITLLSSAIPADQANRMELAKIYFHKAVTKIGRQQNLQVNTRRISFTLTAGKTDYQIGSDILDDLPLLWSIADLWVDESPGYRVSLVSLGDFNLYRAGSTLSQRPSLATVHSEKSILLFWPIPDKAYPIIGSATGPIPFEQIPQQFHDAVVDEALLSIVALRQEGILLQQAGQSLKDVQDSSRMGWKGTHFRMPYPLARVTRITTTVDSGNMTGEEW